jgi:hypothetical protein
MDDMDFRRVTDLLGVEAKVLAEALGVPVQSIRQMRADPESASYRPPPLDWMRVVGRLAKSRALELLKVANELHRADTGE